MCTLYYFSNVHKQLCYTIVLCEYIFGLYNVSSEIVFMLKFIINNHHFDTIFVIISDLELTRNLDTGS